jgi:hypothetical protein
MEDLIQAQVVVTQRKTALSRLNSIWLWLKHPKHALLVTILLFLGIGIAFTSIDTQPGHSENSQPSVQTSISASLPPVEVTVPRHLDGVLVPAKSANQRPLAVMIENHPDSRPQSGLAHAQVVYEAIAEGGITRFMAVFAQAEKPARVGPIRSARTYFVDFATELTAMYAHVGGSAPALAQISTTNVLDLNQSSIGEPTFKRDFSRKVALEHTMYSSTEKLWAFGLEKRKWSANTDLASLSFQDDIAKDMRPASQSIRIDVSEEKYAVTWDYDATSNSYSRSMAGKKHVDADGTPITTKSLILQEVKKKSVVEPGNKVIWEYTLTGSGPVTIVQNGTVIHGTWKKSGTERTRYFDGTNSEIVLVRGGHWVHVVHSDSSVVLP